ncbi:uncharacterized protein [Typha latifolia]|uniref:uncharacterized protein isoform X1 n=1 Tax=Typha latifolia TaxID=4733 RepID=UPI003C2ABCE1
MSRRSGACVRCCLVVLAVTSALCVSGPALYWRYKKGFAGTGRSRSTTCAPCICDCPPPLSLHNIAPGLVTWFSDEELLDICGRIWSYSSIVIEGLINLSITDCGKHDLELNKEMEKQFVDLLSEELKLQEVIAEEHTHHINTTLLGAKRLASQYQKEAEKCNAATETCEEARERAEAALIKEKKITALWERRARQFGWRGS